MSDGNESRGYNNSANFTNTELESSVVVALGHPQYVLLWVLTDLTISFSESTLACNTACDLNYFKKC